MPQARVCVDGAIYDNCLATARRPYKKERKKEMRPPRHLSTLAGALLESRGCIFWELLSL